MKDKRVLIIGAGTYSKKNASIKGIGTCLVERLAQEDHLTILFTYCKSQNGAKKLIEGIKSKDPNFRINCLRFNSLNCESEWQNLNSELEKFGIPHIFVYNAGLRFYKEKLTEPEKEATMRVNYSCPIFLIEKIGEKIHQQRIRGKIILTSSVLAGQHHPFLEDYCLTKGLLEKYVQDNSEYFNSRGIDIMVVSPDVTKTPMTEERIDKYEEEARRGERPQITSPKGIAEDIASLCLK